MNELLWFLAGAGAGALLLLLLPRRRRAVTPLPVQAPSAEAAPAPESPLFRSLARELADIASGVEGNAFLLVETARLVPSRIPAIDGLWLSVRRLRRFHDKIRALVAVPSLTTEPVDLAPLLGELREELRTGELGLRISRSVPDDLPRLSAHHDSLLCALSFVCHALRELEPGAQRLSMQVEHDFDDDSPKLELELQLEYDEDPDHNPIAAAPEASFHLARNAAENLLHGLGASVRFERDPGQAARALILLPVATLDGGGPDPATAGTSTSESPAGDARRHDYGGVLVLEHDPAVRSMVASELKASGRAVFACADVAAARSLLQATPNRFEMLVVDQASRLGPADALAATAGRLCPELKVFVLSACEPRDLPPDIARRAHCLSKPFGLHELRRALAAALAERP